MTRAKDISKIVTDADLSGTLDVTGTVTAGGLNSSVSRTSGANATAITLSDNVTGAQTSGFGTRIVGASNNNGAVSAIGFEADGGTNNDTAISLYTQPQAGLLRQRFKVSREGDISFYEDTGTTPKLFWDASQQSLGVNTSSPTAGYMLHVGGSSGVHTKVKIEATTATGQAELDLSADPAGVSYLNLGDEDSYNIGRIGYFHSDNSMRFQTNSAERMRIDSSGRVGIGGTLLVYPLEVYGANGDGLVFKETTNSVTNWFGGFNSAGTVGTLTNHPLTLVTNATERMRIDTSGNLLLQKTTATNSGGGTFFKVPTTPSTMPVYLHFCKTYSGLRDAIVFLHNGSGVGGITFDNTSTSYNTSSDHRLKENVTADWDATTRLKQLNPVRFNFIADADKTVDGFLAHEVQSVVPEAITGNKDAVDADGNPVYQGIDQSKLVPLLVKTIQELEARITALENGE